LRGRSPAPVRRANLPCRGVDRAVAVPVLVDAVGASFPFPGRDRASLAGETPAEALTHPTRERGLVSTTRSSTPVDMGIEVIAAPHRLGGRPAVEIRAALR
jgi:1-deoxy-D-xylulose 5-phosphate reductoisomerase